ncbi:MAG: JAB domain-containing protein [Bacteriovoracia bacterium]
MMDSIPKPDRRERCLRDGPDTLSLQECLALILGSGPPGVGSLGLAARLLSRGAGGLPHPEQARAFFHALEQAPRGFVADVPGLGPAGKARVLAGWELGRRYAIHRLNTMSPSLSASVKPSPGLSRFERVLKRIPEELRSAPFEWLGFVAVYEPTLARENSVGEFCLVEKGCRTHVNMEPAELFARVLALRPVGFYLFHNHPRGSLTASEEDRELTARVRQCARTLGVPLIGHWIVTSRDYAPVI